MIEIVICWYPDDFPSAYRLRAGWRKYKEYGGQLNYKQFAQQLREYKILRTGDEDYFSFALELV